MISHELATYLILKCDDILDTLSNIIFFDIFFVIAILILTIAVYTEDADVDVKKTSRGLFFFSLSSLIISTALHTFIPSTKQAQQIFSQELKS